MEQPPPQYIRVNVLIAIAILVVILCLFVVVQITVKDEFAKGILTLVLGRFLGYVDNIYNYEFGTTRSSAKKDDTITNLTASAATTASTAQAAQTASDADAAKANAALPASPASIKANNVNVDANTVVVEQPKGDPK